MNRSNKIFKLFSILFVATVLLFIISGYAMNKAIAEDPQIAQKIEASINDTYKGANIKFSLKGNSIGLSDDSNFLHSNKSWSLPSKLAEIDIKTLTADVNFFESSDENVLIRVTGSLKKDQTSLVKTLITDSEAAIEELGPDVAKDIQIEVFLPRAFKGKINLATISGNQHLENIQAPTIQLKNVSGEINMENCDFTELLAKSVSGEVILKMKKGFALKSTTETISGHVETELESDTTATRAARIQTVSGNIEIR